MSISEELKKKMRDALRISNTGEAITAEIEDTIAAALADLAAVGVVKLDESDALIVRAVKLYCRAEFNFNNKGEQYRASYDLQKMSLSLDADYIKEAESGG